MKTNTKNQSKVETWGEMQYNEKILQKQEKKMSLFKNKIKALKKGKAKIKKDY